MTIHKNPTRCLIAILLLAGACTKRVVEPRFSDVVIDTLLGDRSAGYQVNFRFASIDNADASAALEAIEQSNIGYFFQLEAFTGTVTEAVAAALGDLSADSTLSFAADNPSLNPYELTVESEGTVIDSLLCYTINRWSYMGGAHGMYATECHTYTLAEGYELTAADFFGEARMEPLLALIRTKLYERYNTSSDRELTERGFFPEQLYVTENFLPGTDGVTFIYNPYDIGCYALGSVEVTVTREELEAL